MNVFAIPNPIGKWIEPAVPIESTQPGKGYEWQASTTDGRIIVSLKFPLFLLKTYSAKFFEKA